MLLSTFYVKTIFRSEMTTKIIQNSFSFIFAFLRYPQSSSSLCNVLTIQQLQHSHNRAAPDRRLIHLSALVSHWCLSLWLRPRGISTQGTFQQQTQPAMTASCFSEWTTMSFQQCVCGCPVFVYVCVCSQTPLASSSRMILWPRPLSDALELEVDLTFVHWLICPCYCFVRRPTSASVTEHKCWNSCFYLEISLF